METTGATRSISTVANALPVLPAASVAVAVKVALSPAPTGTLGALKTEGPPFWPGVTCAEIPFTSTLTAVASVASPNAVST